MEKEKYVIKLRLTRAEKLRGDIPIVVIARADSDEPVLTLHESPVRRPVLRADKAKDIWQPGPFAKYVLRLLNNELPAVLGDGELEQLRQSMGRVREMNRSVATSLARTAQLLKIALGQARTSDESAAVMGEIEQELDAIITALQDVIGDVTERTEEVAAELA